jgi:hypothetical protein
MHLHEQGDELVTGLVKRVCVSKSIDTVWLSATAAEHGLWRR